MDDQTFRTSDMVLATLFHMAGADYTHESSPTVKRATTQHTCQWVFQANDGMAEVLTDVLVTYSQGKTRVEPREFAGAWADIRSDMYDYLRQIGAKD